MKKGLVVKLKLLKRIKILNILFNCLKRRSRYLQQNQTTKTRTDTSTPRYYTNDHCLLSDTKHNEVQVNKHRGSDQLNIFRNRLFYLLIRSKIVLKLFYFIFKTRLLFTIFEFNEYLCVSLKSIFIICTLVLLLRPPALCWVY